MKDKLILAVLTATLTSCATSYDTEKSWMTGNTGFSESQLTRTIWQIDFTGNTYTGRDKTKTFVLKKAADIAITQGYPYFVVIDNETNRDVTGSASAGYGAYGLYGLGYGGSSHAYSKTSTTTTIELLKKKVSGRGIVYDAMFLKNK